MSEDLQFLELSLPVNDIRRSLEWYRGLGFVELTTNDVRHHHYAVVSNGDFAIGFHTDQLPAPALSFVQPNMARHILDRMEQGEEFLHAKLGVDDFHEAVQTDPDGNLAVTLEARTFSPGHAESNEIGHLQHMAIPCMHVADSLDFWQRYSFIAVESDDADHAELHTPGLVIELHAGTRDLTLRFAPADCDNLIARLHSQYKLRMFRHGETKGVELTAPEGTRIQFIRT